MLGRCLLVRPVKAISWAGEKKKPQHID